MTLDAAATGGSVTSVGQDRPCRSLRPRLAASILLLDRSGPEIRVLVGRRSSAHVFMPDLHVFPGGRRDASDHRIPFGNDLPAIVMERLLHVCDRRLPISGARALALAGLRELYEETGIAVGPAATGALPFRPDLGALRYIARAITPPGYARRFDAHFFSLFTDDAGIDPSAGRDSGELQDLRWVPVTDPSAVRLPEITLRILDALRTRLDADPFLGFDGAVPFFRVRHGRDISDLL